MGHERFERSVYAFVSDFTGAAAKWLVKLSPYVVPVNLSTCIERFDIKIRKAFTFSTGGMALVNLDELTPIVNKILESMPEIAALNKPKSGHTNNIFVSRFGAGPENPDDDFIDIMAVAQNITCEFAQREDAEAWLDRKKGAV
jgi:hypothetical protein